MSVQLNQYVMRGIKLPQTYCAEWERQNPSQDFYETFEKYIDDSAYKAEIGGLDGLFCLFDGMSGKYIIIGEVLAKSADGDDIGILEVNSDVDLSKQQELKKKIEEVFGIRDLSIPMNVYFINHYR